MFKKKKMNQEEYKNKKCAVCKKKLGVGDKIIHVFSLEKENFDYDMESYTQREEDPTILICAYCVENMNFRDHDESECDEICKHHAELCKKLHDHMDIFPKKIQEEIRDDVYKHFEP